MNRENVRLGKGANKSRKQALMQEGSEHYKAKRFQEALAAYKEAIRLDPNDAGAYVGKGDCLRQLKLYEEALRAYWQAVAFDPDNISARIGRGYFAAPSG